VPWRYFNNNRLNWLEVTPTVNVNDLEAQVLPLRLQMHELVVRADGYSISLFQGTDVVLGRCIAGVCPTAVARNFTSTLTLPGRISTLPIPDTVATCAV